MKDKTRLVLQSILIGLIVLGILGFAIPLYIKGYLLLFGITVLIAILLVAFFYFKQVKKSYADIEKGIPLEDERSKSLKNRASAISFNLSLYWILFLFWYDFFSTNFFEIQQISTEKMMMIILSGMLIIFASSYLIIKRKEER